METAEIKTVIENLMEQYRYSVDAENKHHHAEAIDWNGDTELPSYESAKELLKELESYASHPSPMSAADMTAREYFDGEGSPLTLSKICNDEEKEFLLQHIELYASGKVHQSKQPPMSAEQVEELGYYYPLFKFFSDEHGLSLLDSQLQDVIHECKKFIEPASPSVKADGWVSVEDGLPEEGQIVDIWEMPRTQILERNLSFKGTDYAKKYHNNTDYYGWRSTNYKFTIEDDGEGKINCFTNTNERYFNINPGGAYHKKLCVENGEVTHWKPLPAPPKQKL